MKTMTIRGVPDSIHRALVERARRNRRSLNKQVIADLAGEEFDMQGADSKHSRANDDSRCGNKCADFFPAV